MPRSEFTSRGSFRRTASSAARRSPPRDSARARCGSLRSRRAPTRRWSGGNEFRAPSAYRRSRCDDLELAVLLDQPRPAAAELVGGRLGELLGELVVAAEIAFHPAQHRARGTRTLRRERMPVEIVVPGLRGVVEELSLGCAHDVLERVAPHVLLRQELIHRIDVFLVVLAVM